MGRLKVFIDITKDSCQFNFKLDSEPYIPEIDRKRAFVAKHGIELTENHDGTVVNAAYNIVNCLAQSNTAYKYEGSRADIDLLNVNEIFIGEFLPFAAEGYINDDYIRAYDHKLAFEVWCNRKYNTVGQGFIGIDKFLCDYPRSGIAKRYNHIKKVLDKEVWSNRSAAKPSKCFKLRRLHDSIELHEYTGLLGGHPEGAKLYYAGYNPNVTQLWLISTQTTSPFKENINYGNHIHRLNI